MESNPHFSQKSGTQIGYDQTCREYADGFIHELENKVLDRTLLRRFAEDNHHKGLMADLGCGPGQTTQFLRNAGVQDIIGIDLSPGMVEVAEKLAKGEIDFQTGDMSQLDLEDEAYGSVVAFYAIVHFQPDELGTVFREIYRVLKPEGEFLFSFHIGSEVKSVDEFLGKRVHLDFYFFEVEKVKQQLLDAGFTLADVIERHPYPDVEFPSKRAYIFAKKKNRKR